MEKNRVGIYMLDVCGHGVPAALVAVAVSQFLLSRHGFFGDGCTLLSPDAVLNHLDEAFPFERFDSYFSIVCLTIDLDRGILAYASAGHPAPLHLSSGGTLKALNHRGPVIGSGIGAPFGQEEIRLNPGDKIVLYTDGVIDNRNRGGQAFGKDRFLRCLRQSAHLPVAHLIHEVHSEMKGFLNGAKPDDDISLLGVEFAGRGSPQAFAG